MQKSSQALVHPCERHAGRLAKASWNLEQVGPGLQRQAALIRKTGSRDVADRAIPKSIQSFACGHFLLQVDISTIARQISVYLTYKILRCDYNLGMRDLSGKTTAKVRDGRLEAQVSRNQKARFQRAAELGRRTLTDFVIASVDDAGVRVVEKIQPSG